jgi:hypothetical protein
MLIDIMFDSPNHRFSEHDQHAILSLCKSLGGQGVPSLYQYQEWKKWCTSLMGAPSIPFTSPSGNLFYVNDVLKAMEMVSLTVITSSAE